MRIYFGRAGEAVVTIDGQATPVGKDDLIIVAPWTDHSLRSESRVRWTASDKAAVGRWPPAICHTTP